MSSNEAFLAAICDNPADDTPRLIYADWLEERGDPRAEFIRVQVELARLPKRDKRRKDLKVREEELLEWYGDGWTQEVFGPLFRQIEFRRGFIEMVRTSTKDFVEHAAGWVTQTPIREVALGGVASEVVRLSASSCAALSSVAKLTLVDNSFDDDAAQTLFGSSYLANLTSLTVSSDALGDRGVECLASAERLKRLTLLEFYVLKNIGDQGMHALAVSANMVNLNRFVVNAGSVSDVGAQALADSPYLSNLRSLDLASNDVGDKGFTALVNSPHLANCTVLNLTGNMVTARGLADIADSPHLRRWASIQLYNSRMGLVDGDALIKTLRSNPDLHIWLGCLQIPKKADAVLSRRNAPRRRPSARPV